MTAWYAWADSTAIAIKAFMTDTIVSLEVVVRNTRRQVVTGVGTVKASLSGERQSRSVSIFAFLTIETTLCVDTSLIKGAIVAKSGAFIQVRTGESIANEPAATCTLGCGTARCIRAHSIVVTIMAARQTPNSFV